MPGKFQNKRIFAVAGRYLAFAGFAMALAGCGMGLSSKYPYSPYEGNWDVELASDECGLSKAEVYSAAGDFAFRAYNGRYYFPFSVTGSKVRMPHRGQSKFF